MKKIILASFFASTSLLSAVDPATSPSPSPAPAQDIASKVVDRAVKGKKAPKVEVDSATLSATEMAEALAANLAQTADFKNARIININVHVGDTIITLGLDEGIDAEEWGMVDNQVEGGAAPASGTLAKPQANNRGPGGKKKLEVRKGNLVILATEDEKAAPAEVVPVVQTSPSPETAEPAAEKTAP